MLAAKEYAELSAGAYAMAVRVKPEDGSPVAPSASLAVHYLRMAGKELQKIAEWSVQAKSAEVGGG